MNVFSPIDQVDLMDLRVRPGTEGVARVASVATSSVRVLWTNAVCAAFLLIGVVGMKDPGGPERWMRPRTEAEPVPVEFAPSAPAISESSPMDVGLDARMQSAPLEVPQLVIPEISAAEVALATPVSDVPMPGVVPEERQALPVAPGGGSTVQNVRGSPGAGTAAVPSEFRAGEGAKEGVIAPAPDYPLEARRRSVEGVVKLEIEVDGEGQLAAVRTLVSSGSHLLDQHTVGWVKRRWRFPVGGTRLLHTEFVYRLTDGR